MQPSARVRSPKPTAVGLKPVASALGAAPLEPAPAYDRSSIEPSVCDALHAAVAAFDRASGALVYANPAFRSAFGDVAAPAPALVSTPTVAAGVQAALDAPCLRDFERQFRNAALVPMPAAASDAGALVESAESDPKADPGADADADSHAATAAAGDGTASDRLHVRSGRWYCLRHAPCTVAAHELVVVELFDISARLRDEQRKRSHHQKLMFTSRTMSVGEMAATLAHELNQPIGSLLNFLNGCLLRLDGGSPNRVELRAALVEARQQCERAASIITRIREFVRAREPKMLPLDLRAVFAAVLALLEAEVHQHRVEVVVDVPRLLPPVTADRVMLEQVVHNLVKNAIEAMRPRTGRRRLRLCAQASPPGFVRGVVQDSGPGIAKATRDQLFSPFFTTKADGLGIGLNICRSMIEFHGGSLYYEQPDEGGSRFCFTLPVHSSPRGTR